MPQLTRNSKFPTVVRNDTVNKRREFRERHCVGQSLISHFDLTNPILSAQFTEHFIEIKEDRRPAGAILHLGECGMPYDDIDLLFLFVDVGREPKLQWSKDQFVEMDLVAGDVRRSLLRGVKRPTLQ